MNEPGSPSVGPPSIAPGPVKVAVVDSDPTARRLMRYWLENAGYQVLEAANADEAQRLSAERPDIACIDLGIGVSPSSGVEVIKMLHAVDPRLPQVVVTAQRDVESAVVAMRAGAYDYVVKPLDCERLLTAMARAKERHQLVRSFERVESGRGFLRGLLSGKSRVLRDLEQQVSRVVERDVALLLVGEQGAGKELLARIIHENSPRAAGPFLAFDCTAFDIEQHRVRLFGGTALDGRTAGGLFQQASGGVLYLEHVERLSPEAQLELAALMSGRGLGDGLSLPAPNVRVLAASVDSLEPALEAGRFREDLYFRLVVFPLRVPPLRKRREDIPQLVAHLLREHGARMGGPVAEEIAPDALEALSAFDWPGNLRQLENVVQRGMLAASGRAVQLGDLPAEVRGVVLPRAEVGGTPSNFASNEIVPLRELERRAIEHALRVTHGSVSLAAKRLGIGRATLYRRIASLDLSIDVL